MNIPMDLIESSNLKKKVYSRKETINIQGNRQYLVVSEVSSFVGNPVHILLWLSDTLFSGNFK